MAQFVAPCTFGGDITFTDGEFTLPETVSAAVLIIGTSGGSLQWQDSAGNNHTISALPAGQYLLNFRKIIEDGTTADGLSYMARSGY